VRIALGFLVAAAALAGALWIHSGLKAERTTTVEHSRLVYPPGQSIASLVPSSRNRSRGIGKRPSVIAGKPTNWSRSSRGFVSPEGYSHLL
jgi:hypothetical protein